MSDTGDAWSDLAAGYERARGREDSLDRLVEWPAQREVLGDVTGLSLLDLGCGNGAKLAELVTAGAATGVGVDVAGEFVEPRPPGLTLVRGDLNDLGSLAEVSGQRFDRVLMLQSFGYATDPLATLWTVRSLLTDDGFVVLTRTQPLRYAVERAEQRGTSLGAEYFSSTPHTYRTSWHDKVSLTKRTWTISDLLNVFSEAGFRVEHAIEPQLSQDDRRRFPHKQAWMERYLGILVFRLRPVDPLAPAPE